MGTRKVSVTVRVPLALLDGHENRSKAIEEGLIMLQRRGTSLRMTELRLRRSSWSDIDRVIEALSSRHVCVQDLQGPGGELSAPIRARLRAVLPPVQARRIEQVLAGGYYEEIGALEGVSKQAVEQAVKRGFARLALDKGFISALVKHFGSEVDPGALLEALQHEKHRSQSRFGAGKRTS